MKLTSYQRLKAENKELRLKIIELDVLVQRDYFIEQFNKRKAQLDALDSPHNVLAFVVLGKEGDYYEMRYDRKHNIKTVNCVQL